MTTTEDRMARGTHQWRGVIEEFRPWLPVSDDTPVVTLCEGGTPLVRAGWLSERTRCDVRLKVEGDNPTGSFKDRGMTVAISKAAEEGAEAVVCASTGNTSASMAAYAVRAGLTPIVLVPHGRIAAAKMAQAVMHAAHVIQVRGWFDDCLTIARGIADSYPVSLVNSVNPARLQGQKTASFEVVDALGDAPDLHVLPVGNAGNISAYWLGYAEYAEAGVSTRTPRMWGFQAAGAAPIVGGAPVPDPETVATAIRVGNPASWDLAVRARDESQGTIDAVSETPETSPRTGWAMPSTPRRVCPHGHRACGGSRRRVRLRSSVVLPCRIQRPSRPRSGSATRHRGTSQYVRGTSRRARSTRCR